MFKIIIFTCTKYYFAFQHVIKCITCVAPICVAAHFRSPFRVNNHKSVNTFSI